MSAVADIARWGYKNPGIWSNQQVHAENPQFGRSTINHVLNVLTSVEPTIFQRLAPGVYHIKPPEWNPAAGEPVAPPAPSAQEQPPAEPAIFDDGELRFQEILPDDQDLYPPFKVQIYDHYRSRKGDKWYRFRDELGRRGVFTWNEEDD